MEIEFNQQTARKLETMYGNLETYVERCFPSWRGDVFIRVRDGQ